MTCVQGGARLSCSQHRTDYDGRVRADSAGPVLAQFNWALDWFDANWRAATAATAPALQIVGDGAARS